MKISTLLTALLCLSLLPPHAIHADEIWMTTGRKLDGTLTDLGNGKVRIEMSFGTLELPADQIARVERGSTAAQEVERVLAALQPGDAEGRFELALWCRDNGEATLERRLLERVILIDPDHEGARHLLGYLRLTDGTWVTEEQLRDLRGEVRFRGDWVTSEERARTLQAEQQQTALRRLQQLEDARLQVETARLQLEASRQTSAARTVPGVVNPVSGIPVGGFPLYGGGAPAYGTSHHGYDGVPHVWWHLQGSHGGTVHGSGGLGTGQARSPRPQARDTGSEPRATTSQPRRHTRGGRVLYAPPPQQPPGR